MKKNKKLLTVSVAAYNLGEMIKKNLDSFVDSKYRDKLEVIVINDGSKDNTKEIIEEYVKKYEDIIVLIDKKNEGAGSTLNNGINNATGKYFKMVDGDDWVITENLDRLIERLENSDYDMILTDYNVFSSEKNEIIRYDKLKNIEENKKLNFYDIYNSNIYMYNVTYKTELLKNNNIKVDNGFYTDQEYLLYPLVFVKDIVYFDLDIYVYLVGREGQSMNLNSLRKHLDMHELVMFHLIEYYENYKKRMNKDVKKFIKSRIVNLINTNLRILLSSNINNEQKKRIKCFNDRIKKSSKEIYSLYKKTKKAFLIINSNYLLLNFVAKSCYKKSDMLKTFERR